MALPLPDHLKDKRFIRELPNGQFATALKRKSIRPTSLVFVASVWKV